MSTETCVKCDTFRLYRTSFTYLEFFNSENYAQKWIINLYSFIPLACAECNDSLPFSEASSIPFCYIPFPSTLFHQLVFHPPSLHLAIYFLVYLSASLFPNSYIILFWEFYFLPFFMHSQTSVISLYDYKFILIASPCDLKHRVHNRCHVSSVKCMRF